MTDIASARILIIATDGFEQSELEVPRDKLTAAGAAVHIASLDGRTIKGWDDKDWGQSVRADLKIEAAKVSDYDALVIPGGVINPDKLRTDAGAVALVKDFITAGKVVAAICHGPWLLVEADVLKGQTATSYASIKTDVKNAGAEWVDQDAVASNGIVTSRSPDDLGAFVAKIIEEIGEGTHDRSAA